MGFESIQLNNTERAAEKTDPKEAVRARNEMQIKLAARFYGFEIGDQQLESWIAENSAKFADILKEHPEFLDEYVRGETDHAVDEVAELLYDHHEAHV